jgi:hypothetical protein
MATQKAPPRVIPSGNSRCTWQGKVCKFRYHRDQSTAASIGDGFIYAWEGELSRFAYIVSIDPKSSSSALWLAADSMFKTAWL